METQAVVGTLDDTLPEAETEILLDTRGDVKSKTLVDTLAH